MENCIRCSDGETCDRCRSGYSYSDDDNECVEDEIPPGEPDGCEDACIDCNEDEGTCDYCNPFTNMEDGVCECKFNYVVSVSLGLDMDINQIAIDTYNLQWDFEELGDDYSCEHLVSFSFEDEDLANNRTVQEDVEDLTCSIKDNN